jgi:hypothetical protein
MLRSVDVLVFPKFQDPIKQDNPDFEALHFPRLNDNTFIEYSVIDPLQRSLVKYASRSEGAAAEKQDDYKRKKYKALLERSPSHTLMPASHETSGRMSKGFHTLVDACATLHDPAVFSVTAVQRSWACRTYKDYWTQRISISFWYGALQMANQRDAANRRRGFNYVPPADITVPRSPSVVDVSPSSSPGDHPAQ